MTALSSAGAAAAQNDILSEIKKQLISRVENASLVNENTNITRDLGLDSLTVMDFIFDLEDSFDISIPMERIAEVQTVADLAQAIIVLQKEAS